MIIRRLFFCLALFLFFFYAFSALSGERKRKWKLQQRWWFDIECINAEIIFGFMQFCLPVVVLGSSGFILLPTWYLWNYIAGIFFLSTKRSRTRNCPEISSKMSTICLSNPDDSIGNFGLWVASPIRIWTCSIDIGIILNEFEVTSLGSKYRWFVHRVRMI